MRLALVRPILPLRASLVGLTVLVLLLSGWSGGPGPIASTDAALARTAAPVSSPTGTVGPARASASPYSDVAPRVSTYTVTFAAQGVPPGVDWSVDIYLPGGSFDVAGSNSQNATIDLANGSYTYSVPPLTTYLPLDPSGNFTVRGAPLTVSVPFYAPALYPVTFSGIGYPNGTRWIVAVTWNDVAASRQTFTFSGSPLLLSLRNDSYSFTVDGPGSYGVDPSVGGFVVAGAPVEIPLTFHVGRYGIDFTENGLPVGTNWSVTVNGSTNSSTTDAIVCHLGNGTYGFAVDPIPGYWILPRSGSLVVRRSITDQLVEFTVATFPVTFTETGLPPGTLWAVNFSGSARASANSTVLFAAANGSHPFAIEGLAGYELSEYRGDLEVAGTANGTVIAWQRTVYSVEFYEVGETRALPWSVELNSASKTAVQAEMNFSEANGSFAFRVTPPTGYEAFPVNGTLAVSGSGSVTWINLTRSPPSGLGLSIGGSEAYLALGIIAGAAALTVAALLVRRRRGPRAVAT